MMVKQQSVERLFYSVVSSWQAIAQCWRFEILMLLRG